MLNLLTNAFTTIQVLFKKNIGIRFAFILLATGLIFFVRYQFFGKSFNDSPFFLMLFPPLFSAIIGGFSGGFISLVLSVVLVVTFMMYPHHQVFFDKSSLQKVELFFFQGLILLWLVDSLNKTNEKNKRLSELKDDFIATVSHELKTPLTSIVLYNHILHVFLQENKDDKGIIIHNKIITQIERISQLVNELLDISKIRQSKFQLQLITFNLDELVEEVRKSMNELFPSHTILFTKEQTIVKKVVLADKNRLTQVLENLISNAIKYSPDKDTVNITTAIEEKNAVIRVQDFGIGISEEDLQSIFDRFYQTKSTSTSGDSGLGLGLYISSEIVKQHKGQIHAHSVKGEGSTFIVKIPLAE